MRAASDDVARTHLISASAPEVIEPPVSIMSSIITAVRPRTSPMIVTTVITSDLFGSAAAWRSPRGRSRSISASARARVTPPTSGETTTTSRSYSFRSIR